MPAPAPQLITSVEAIRPDLSEVRPDACPDCLQVLGDGDLPFALTVKAETFSKAAREKIEAAGGTAVEVPRKPTWTRKLHAQRLAAAGGVKGALGAKAAK